MGPTLSTIPPAPALPTPGPAEPTRGPQDTAVVLRLHLRKVLALEDSIPKVVVVLNLLTPLEENQERRQARKAHLEPLKAPKRRMPGVSRRHSARWRTMHTPVGKTERSGLGRDTLTAPRRKGNGRRKINRNPRLGLHGSPRRCCDGRMLRRREISTLF